MKHAILGLVFALLVSVAVAEESLKIYTYGEYDYCRTSVDGMWTLADWPYPSEGKTWRL